MGIGTRMGIYSQAGVAPPFAFNNALDFAGGQSVMFNAINLAGEFTTATWFYLTATGSVIFSNSANASVLGMFTALSNQIRINTGTSGNKSFSVPAIALNTWHYCLQTRDSSFDVKTYLNGVESTTGSVNATGTMTIDSVSGYPSGGAFFLDGRADELGIIDVYATPTMQLALYNSGLGADFASVMGSPSLHYKMDQDCPDAFVLDSSSNNNDGTMQNFTGCNFNPH